MSRAIKLIRTFRFLRTLLVSSEFSYAAGKIAMLAYAIPCQIHFTDKQRNANVSWDFRLLTVSVPFAHCNED